MRLSLTRNRLLVAVAASVILAATGVAVAEEDHDTKEAWRLFVADHTNPIVRVIDFEDGKELGGYDVKGYASLTASTSGQTVFAAQTEAGVIHAIKTGINFSDHGEHSDLEVSEPALLPVTFEGKRPGHVVPHDDHVVLFYDGSDKAEIVDEADILDGKVEKRIVDTIKPHHGVAVTMGRYALVSAPNTEIETKPDELPPRIGLRVVDEKGSQVGDTAPCTDLHGEATSARLVAFGCKEGVLVAHPGGLDGPKLTMLPYPADFPKAYTGTLLGGKAMQFFLGNYGDDKLVLIDPDAEQPYKLIELPTRRVDFQLDPAEPRNAYILTEDGNLHVLDVVKGEIVNKARVTEPYSKDGHWRDPRPRLAVADGQIAVTDPRHSLVRVVDPDTLKETRTIAVEGQPFSIVAVGGSGASH
ncbi:metallochaperone AztD [Rhizobium leguminosarum]|uniref:zinc metallochaperone AztD n=1 Tax=Rhizobium leguminosarum TaxID=384 RepID=UPI001C94B9E0|nr:zinc metallochaperone AztD [Rhizobium leguminosarum]MBY5639355.1 metallochaperone AztD [Rhizobium leguminosarum]